MILRLLPVRVPRAIRSLLLVGLLAAPVFVPGVCFASAQTTDSSAPPATATRASGGNATPEAQSAEKNQSEVDENEAYRHSAVVHFLGGKLGLSTEQAASVFEVFNFVVLAGLLGWLVLKTVPKMFRDRSSMLQKRLVEARAASEEAAARMSSVEGRLAALDSSIAGMRVQAEKDLAAEEGRLRAAIEEERGKILAATEAEIAAATAQARREIRQYAAELAVDQAAKKLVVSAETDRLLVQEFANRLAGKSGEAN